jgi:4-amino-4-deoxy-L-arabinose transferase-like glycosyltransferase/Flp pilus assembly protein TadD
MNQRGPAPRTSRGISTHAGRILLIILAGGAALRGAYLGEIAGNPDYLSPGVDAGFHQYWAAALVTGDWSTGPGIPDPETHTRPFVRPPGYPYFLAAVYSVFGVNAFPPRVVQMLLGLGSIALACFIGKRWFSAGVGLVWAALMASYWSFIYFEGELQAPVLVILLYLGAVYTLGRWIERPRAPWAAATGILLGAAALTTPNNLVLVPVAALALAVLGRRRNMTRQGIVAGALLSAGALAAIAPATLRNFAVAHDVVLISANGGVNLYIGNNPSATAHAAGDVPPFGKFNTPYDYPALVASAERYAGRKLSYSEASRYFREKALEFIAQHPARFVELAAEKALLFWGPVEVANNKDDQIEREFSPVLSRLPGNFSMMLALGLVGIPLALSSRLNAATQSDARTRVQRPLLLIVLAFMVAYFLSFVPFFVAGRYRIPLVAWILLFASIALCRIVQSARSRQWRFAATALVSSVACYVVCAHRFVPLEPSLARWHMDRGMAFARLGEFDNALSHYEKSEQAGGDWPNVHMAMANSLRRLKRPDEALLRYDRVILGASPYRAEAHLGKANLLAELQRFDEALLEYAAAITLDPEATQARLERAQVLCRAGRSREAVPELERLATELPNDAGPLYWLGLALHEQGRFDESRQRLRAAVQIAPELAEVLPQMGIDLGAVGDSP